MHCRTEDKAHTNLNKCLLAPSSLFSSATPREWRQDEGSLPYTIAARARATWHTPMYTYKIHQEPSRIQTKKAGTPRQNPATSLFRPLPCPAQHSLLPKAGNATIKRTTLERRRRHFLGPARPPHPAPLDIRTLGVVLQTNVKHTKNAFHEPLCLSAELRGAILKPRLDVHLSDKANKSPD